MTHPFPLKNEENLTSERKIVMITVIICGAGGDLESLNVV